MLSTALGLGGDATTKFTGSGLPCGEAGFTAIHVRAARGIWPRKTAEHWAAEAGVTVRMAKYWLAGSYMVSDSGKIALARLLLQ